MSENMIFMTISFYKMSQLIMLYYIKVSNMEYKKYKKEDNVSFSFGGFPTYELLKTRPEYIREIILHEKLENSPQTDEILLLAKKHNIRISRNGKLIEKLSQKGNVFIMGVFEKYSQHIEKDTNHVLLVNPSDMGNLGTIIRVMLGFGYTNLGIITPSVDIFDPKVIRASMGSVFNVKIELFDSFDAYKSQHNNVLYPFMLKAQNHLQNLPSKPSPHTLIFGNEAHGLDDSYLNVGTPILIKHSNLIDSLNLSMSVGIALYEFSKK